jgi:hypothetical protein
MPLGTHWSSTSEHKQARLQRIGRWLVSTLAWGPLLVWVAWPLLDERMAWHPLAGYSGMLALLLNWAYHGRYGVNQHRWPTFVAVGVAFNVSFSVAARAEAVGTFAAVSALAGALVGGLVVGLIVVVAVRLARVRDYGLLEDQVLLAAPLIVGAKMAGITTGAITHGWDSLLLGVLAGLAAGAVVSIFCLAWVYSAVGVAAWWVVRREQRSGAAPYVWWVTGPPSSPTRWQEP